MNLTMAQLISMAGDPQKIQNIYDKLVNQCSPVCSPVVDYTLQLFETIIAANNDLDHYGRSNQFTVGWPNSEANKTLANMVQTRVVDVLLALDLTQLQVENDQSHHAAKAIFELLKIHHSRFPNSQIATIKDQIENTIEIYEHQVEAQKKQLEEEQERKAIEKIQDNPIELKKHFNKKISAIKTMRFQEDRIQAYQKLKADIVELSKNNAYDILHKEILKFEIIYCKKSITGLQFSYSNESNKSVSGCIHSNSLAKIGIELSEFVNLKRRFFYFPYLETNQKNLIEALQPKLKELLNKIAPTGHVFEKYTVLSELEKSIKASINQENANLNESIFVTKAQGYIILNIFDSLFNDLTEKVNDLDSRLLNTNKQYLYAEVIKDGYALLKALKSCRDQFENHLDIATFKRNINFIFLEYLKRDSFDKNRSTSWLKICVLEMFEQLKLIINRTIICAHNFLLGTTHSYQFFSLIHSDTYQKIQTFHEKMGHLPV